MVECLFTKQMVAGSIPVAVTYKIYMLYTNFKCSTLNARPDFMSASKLGNLPAF